MDMGAGPATLMGRCEALADIVNSTRLLLQEVHVNLGTGFPGGKPTAGQEPQPGAVGAWLTDIEAKASQNIEMVRALLDWIRQPAAPTPMGGPLRR